MDDEGGIYVSVDSTSATDGRVIRISPVVTPNETAEIGGVEDGCIALEVDGAKDLLRRNTDRPVPFLVDLKPEVDPIEPIVYYVDPGAPAPIQRALIEGAQWWDTAFEAAALLRNPIGGTWSKSDPVRTLDYRIGISQFCCAHYH